MTSSNDPVMDIRQITAEIFPGTAESTVNGWSRPDRRNGRPDGMFGKPAGKVGRANVWYRSAVIAGAKAAGRLDADGRPTPVARGTGSHRRPPVEPQYDTDGTRLLTRPQVLAMFSSKSEATVRNRWMAEGRRGFPTEPARTIGTHPLWRLDTLTAWADAEGIDYVLPALPEGDNVNLPGVE